jgi:RND family efflux transporter MFP subunit
MRAMGSFVEAVPSSDLAAARRLNPLASLRGALVVSESAGAPCAGWHKRKEARPEPAKRENVNLINSRESVFMIPLVPKRKPVAKEKPNYPRQFSIDRRLKNTFLIAGLKFMSPKPSLDDLRIERSAAPGPKSRFWPIVLSFAVILLLAASAFYWFRENKSVEVKTIAAREVSSGKNATADHTVLNASGYVTARRQATVSSKVTGKVIEILIEEGMKVKEGQILARLDDTNTRASFLLAEAQLKSAEAALAETRVRIDEAEKELKRQSDLVKSKIATQADYEHAEASALSLKAKLEQQQADIVVAQRSVATWQQQLDDAIIRAPFSGMVTSKNAQPGEMISPISAGGGFTRTGICTIVDMESLEIEIDVNESYINRVQASQPVEATLDAYPEWKIPCKVIAIIPTADRQKSTVKARVGFDKLDPRILPEMSVKVAFRESAGAVAGGPRGVSVPKGAIQQQDGKDVVLVVQNGRAERRAVTVASMGADEAVISAGLTAGERVVTDRPSGLTDGAQVKEIKQ